MSEPMEMTDSLGDQNESREIFISEMDNVTEIEDNALIIVEDSENTKTMTIDAFRRNLITDGDAPSESKVYSSQKVFNILEKHKEEMNLDLSRTNTQIDFIKENYAKTDNVNEQMKDIHDKMLTNEDLQGIKSSLNSKRDNNTPITRYDMDISADDNKIKLQNLSEEVLSAITGETPVSLVRSPQGGWTTEAIANKAITCDKLSNAYRFRGLYKEGSVNDLLNDGVYLLGPNVEDVPKLTDDEEDMKILYVTLYGENREYVSQRIEYCYEEEERPYYTRKGKTANIYSVKFNTIHNITSKFKINSDLLGDVITDRGTISSGNVFDYTAEGSYKVLKGITNMPTAEDEYFLTVSKHDNYYVYEARLKSEVSCIIYIAYSYMNEYGITITTKWFKITNINKSKFDGQRLHLFGDGICFGLGSSDISKYAYPYILYDKYGFRVLNHAINDATAGNYGVKTTEEKSLLTQIRNTSFEDGDIAIIHVGTNDFKKGSCLIGNDTDMKDTTFKGSLNLAVKNIFEKNKTVKLLFVTPLFRSRMDSGDNRDCDSNAISGRYLKEYVNAVNTIASLNHIPCLDMYNAGIINKYNAEHWLYDGLYLNDNGHDMYATRLYDTLNSLF